jgi:hypothetical protein
LSDLKFAIRLLLQNPGFTAVAVVTLALGIGATTSIFSVVNAVLLRPLPYRQPGQLVQVKKERPTGAESILGGGELVGNREFSAWKNESQALAGLAAYAGGQVNLSGALDPERLSSGEVTRNFFSLLGVQLMAGREFTLEEDRPGGPPVVILSHGLWQRRFGAQPGLVGGSITLDGASHTVVGILPPTFQFPEPFELWRPLRLDEHAVDLPAGAGVRIRLLRVLGRLKPGVTPARARAELDLILSRLEPGPRDGPGGRAPARGPLPGPLPPAGQATNAPEDLVPLGPAVDGDAPVPQAQPALPIPGVRMLRQPLGNSTPGPAPQVMRFENPPPAMPTAPGAPADVLAPGPPPSAGDPGPPLALFGPPGRVQVVGLHEQVAGKVRFALLVLLGAVALVLLIACANVANLLLARAAARQREIAVRAALGATGRRLARQLLVESLVLALLGAVGGLLLAFSGMGLLRSLTVWVLPHLYRITIDAWVLGFAVVAALATGLAFGLAPALQASSLDLNETLKDGQRQLGGAPGRHRLRDMLVVLEVALALVLLAGAGLLIKSFVRLRSVSPGFEPAGLLTTTVYLTPAKYALAHQQRAYFAELLERVRALPGVLEAGLTDHLPLTDYAMMLTMRVEGRPATVAGRQPAVSIASVSPGYFRTMGIPLKRGQGLTDHDGEAARAVGLVNEAFARRFLPGEDPIGKRLSSPAAPDGWMTIVGVVGDVRQSGLDSDAAPEVYVPQLQQPRDLMSLVVRTGADPMSLAAAVRAQARLLDAEQPLHTLLTMEQRLASSMASRRLHTWLLGMFAGLAWLLAAVGIYGVMSYAVTQRTAEIGVRMALGAQRADVVRLVVGQGMGLIVLGLGLGAVGALALTRFLASLLFDVRPTDPFTFAGVACLLGLAALIACYLPARRAARVDPMVALRCE